MKTTFFANVFKIQGAWPSFLRPWPKHELFKFSFVTDSMIETNIGCYYSRGAYALMFLLHVSYECS